jgi:hypothetical protein
MEIHNIDSITPSSRSHRFAISSIHYCPSDADLLPTSSLVEASVNVWDSSEVTVAFTFHLRSGTAGVRSVAVALGKRASYTLVTTAETLSDEAIKRDLMRAGVCGW